MNGKALIARMLAKARTAGDRVMEVMHDFPVASTGRPFRRKA